MYATLVVGVTFMGLAAALTLVAAFFYAAFRFGDPDRGGADKGADAASDALALIACYAFAKILAYVAVALFVGGSVLVIVARLFD